MKPFLLLVVAAASCGFAGCSRTAPPPPPERKVYAHFMGCWPAAMGALPHSLREEAKITASKRFARAAKDPCEAVGGRIVNWPLLPEGYATNALADAKLEIARAIRAGIDGFAFDAWAGGDSARQLLDTFFQAAEEMKVDFGLTVCFDPSCHPHGPNDGTMLDPRRLAEPREVRRQAALLRLSFGRHRPARKARRE